MIRSSILLLCLLLATAASAQEPTTADFNAAWKDYQAAKAAGKPGELVDTASRVLDIGEALFGPDDERVPMLMSNYGTALFEAGDRYDALDVLEKSVDRTAEIHGKRSAQMIPVLMNYADARIQPFDAKPMASTYDDALRIAKNLYGEQSLDYAGIALRAGLVILGTNDTTVAVPYLRKANDVFQALVGPEDVRTAFAQLHLGKFELASRDYDDAIEYLLGALEGFAGGTGKNQEYELVTRAFLVQAYENRGMSEEATEHCLAIGQNSMIEPDQDYLPIFRKAPSYPRNMLVSNKTGHVDLAFTVDESGFVQNPEVIDLVGGDAFSDAALEAVARFRYAPRFEDGKPVASHNVKTRITFAIEE